jgi:hypothetical protein
VGDRRFGGGQRAGGEESGSGEVEESGEGDSGLDRGGTGGDGTQVLPRGRCEGRGKLAPKDTHPPNLIDATWDHGSTDGEIFTNIKDGIGPKFDMKPMKAKMMDPDIWNVVNYLRSLGPKAR